MSLPYVAQAQALGSELERLLRLYRPASFALLGCSGGNGLERVDPMLTRRVVALDVNPEYVRATAARFGRSFSCFEPLVCDISLVEAAPFRPVDLLFAGLLLEYVPLLPALRLVRSGLESGGIFGCVFQRESSSLGHVSPSPYASLSLLSPHMTTLARDDVEDAAGRCGLRAGAVRDLRMPNGKILVSQVYEAE